MARLEKHLHVVIAAAVRVSIAAAGVAASERAGVAASLRAGVTASKRIIITAAICIGIAESALSVTIAVHPANDQLSDLENMIGLLTCDPACSTS